MKTFLIAAVALLALVPQQAGQPINAMCPVKPRQKARASLTVVYEGQVIGLCCASCVERFKENPKAFAATIPEFKAPERKPGPCACEKTAKGYYCVDDQKELVEADLKSGACPTCGKKPEKCEYCLKTADGEKTPQRSRITYSCAGCSAVGDFEKTFKHEEACKKKTSPLTKVCSKSGSGPHVTMK
jgi:YHS domain-containing protein